MKEIIDKITPTPRVRQHLIEYGFATLLICVAVWLFVGRNVASGNEEVKAEVQRTHGTVNQIQSQIDSVRARQDLIVERTAQLEQAQRQTLQLLETGNSLLLQNKRAIEKIRLDNNEKISGAANYNYQQLDSFFSSRYRGH